MKFIDEILERWREWRENHKCNKLEKAKEQAEQEAEDLFQIAEYDGDVWLTFDDNLVCPCYMLKSDVIASLNIMRELYIKRNIKE